MTGSCQPSVAPPPSRHTLHQSSVQSEVILIKAWISAYAVKYNVDPAFATAVAHIESRKGRQEFRTGRLSRTYYGPMGIHKCFKHLGIDQTERNIEVGVEALRGVAGDTTKQKKRLRKYNTSFNMAYWKQIKQAEGRYRHGF